MHARQQILNALRDKLDAAVTPPWAGVYVSGIVPGTASLPCVLVRQLEETVDDLGIIHFRQQLRRVSVSFLVVAKARSNPEDTTAALNDAAVAVEKVITLALVQAALANVKDGYLQTVEINEEPDESGYVSLDLVWWFEYMTSEGSPETLVA
jgi:hypothetical protein